jgi:hypothetical protein
VTTPPAGRYPSTVTALSTAGLGTRIAFRNDDIAYVAVTRFNLVRHRRDQDPADPVEQEDDEWCASRVDAFDVRCLPTLLGQRILPHAWFIVFHEVTPPSIVELLDRLRRWPWIVPLFATREQGFAHWGEVLTPGLRAFASELGKSHVCSVRIDSDDSVHPLWFTMLDRVIEFRLANQDWEETFCINLANGVVREKERMLLMQTPRNQFQAVVEPAIEAKGPYRTMHSEIDRVMPVYEVLNSYPLWMYHRHGANLSPQKFHGYFEIEDPKRQAALLDEFGLGLLKLVDGFEELSIPVDPEPPKP